MLHRISLPYQPEELAGIFALQLELLRVACSVTKIDRAAVENTFSDARIVDWITATYARSVGPLNQFASQCPLSVKQEIIETLQADYGFWEHRVDPSFAFRFKTSEPYRQIIAVWLRGYFEQFGRGIDAVITGSQFVNKNKWIEAFRKANPDVLTCPVCDGSMKSGVTVEHFFPRSRYPVLSVHVANLIPTCTDCNGPKEDSDPLEKVGVTDIFLPYHRYALQSCDVQVRTKTDGSYEFGLMPEDGNPGINLALGEMERLFEVQKQWTKNAQQIVDIALARVREEIDAYLDDGIPVGAEPDFCAMLEKLCQRMTRQRGRQHYYVPASSWLTWARDNYAHQLWDGLDRASYFTSRNR